MITKTISFHHSFLLGSVLAAGLFISANIAAQSALTQQAIAVDIAAQPLEQAITQLATQADLLIGVDANLVTGKQAPALNGYFTPMQAIGQLLRGSGLIVVENAPGRYTLEAAPVNRRTENSADAVTLPEIKVSGGKEHSQCSRDRHSWKKTEARLAILTWIELWYDPIRRHSGLGYLSPISFERKLNENNQIAINCSSLSQVEIFSTP